MSIEVQKLFSDIYQKYGAIMLTRSTYGKEARWVHNLEFIEYATYLHGGELIFNASLNECDDDERKQAVNKLIARRSAGLVMSTFDERKPSEALIAYCDEKNFPLIWVNFNAPFIDMLHESFDLLVYEDRNDRTREEAFRNAVVYSDEPDRYMELMETDVFFAQAKYTVLIAGYDNRKKEDTVSELAELFHCHISRNVTFPERNNLVVLLIGYTQSEIKTDIQLMSGEHSKMRIAIGATVDDPRDIRNSYDKAKMAFNMMPALNQKILAYSDLGIYKMLYEVRDNEIANEFIEEILGRLIRYDKENSNDYMEVLESFMNNECMVSQTADDMFFHRNTIKYKLAAIRDVLGYDITLNENRFKIMMAFYLMKMKNK